MDHRGAGLTIAAFAGLFVAFLCLVVLAPALVSFALAVAAAIAWNIWSEKHPERTGAGARVW